MIVTLAQATWPAAELASAVEHLTQRAGLSRRPLGGQAPSATVLANHGDARQLWIETAVAAMGLDLESEDVTYAGVDALLASVSVALIELQADGNTRYLAVLGSSRRHLKILASDLRHHTVAVRRVRGWLCREANTTASTTEKLLDAAGVAGGRRHRARAAIDRELRGETRVARCLQIRPRAGSSFARQLRDTGCGARLAAVIGAHAVQYGLLVASWAMIGRAALEGRFDRGWLLAWTLLLATIVPIRLFETWTSGTVAIGIGGLLRRRLLAGALALEPDEIREKGAGQFLASVLESEAVESLALGGGLLALVSVVELAVALAVLAFGAGGVVHVVALLLWIAIAAAMGRWSFARRRAWTATRLEMTDDLVERIVGHRTRLVQESPDHWHDGEERLLQEYSAQSKALDRAHAALHAVVARGWLIAGVLALVPAFVAGRASTAGLAIGLGGTLAAWRAFEKLAEGFSQLAAARLAWNQISLLFHAAARSSPPGSPAVVAAPVRGLGSFNRTPVVEADGLVLRYQGRAEPALAGAGLRIQAGERVLLEGPSGGGKSTLASVLAGLRAPSSGLLLSGGLDRQTLGAAGWRRRAVSAPQFHENHVLTASFAFNLLMGRRWPAEAADLDEADAVCRELGLGPLLDRMPSGLLQMVGESGWRLSHGERSRLFIARALLQRADFIVLDESFAALDPGTLQQAMRCVQKRAPTLMVIAHP